MTTEPRKPKERTYEVVAEITISDVLEISAPSMAEAKRRYWDLVGEARDPYVIRSGVTDERIRQVKRVDHV